MVGRVDEGTDQDGILHDVKGRSKSRSLVAVSPEGQHCVVLDATGECTYGMASRSCLTVKLGMMNLTVSECIHRCRHARGDPPLSLGELLLLGFTEELGLLGDTSGSLSDVGHVQQSGLLQVCRYERWGRRVIHESQTRKIVVLVAKGVFVEAGERECDCVCEMGWERISKERDRPDTCGDRWRWRKAKEEEKVKGKGG